MSNVIRFHQLNYPLCDFTLTDISKLAQMIKINYKENGQIPFITLTKGNQSTNFNRDTKENIAQISIISFIKILDLLTDSHLYTLKNNLYRTTINSYVYQINYYVKKCIEQSKIANPIDLLNQFIDSKSSHLVFYIYNILCGYSVDKGLKIQQKAYEEIRNFKGIYPDGLATEATKIKKVYLND